MSIEWIEHSLVASFSLFLFYPQPNIHCGNFFSTLKRFLRSVLFFFVSFIHFDIKLNSILSRNTSPLNLFPPSSTNSFLRLCNFSLMCVSFRQSSFTVSICCFVCVFYSFHFVAAANVDVYAVFFLTLSIFIARQSNEWILFFARLSLASCVALCRCDDIYFRVVLYFFSLAIFSVIDARSILNCWFGIDSVEWIPTDNMFALVDVCACVRSP